MSRGKCQKGAGAVRSRGFREGVHSISAAKG